MSSLDEAELLKAFPNKTSPLLPQENILLELAQASQLTTMTSFDEEDLLRRYPGHEVIWDQDDVAMQDIPMDIDAPAFGSQISTEPNYPIPKKSPPSLEIICKTKKSSETGIEC